MAKKERAKVVEKLDAVFSEYIRRRYADHGGFVRCYTCGAEKHWKQMHAGHFQSRSKYATRWNETNVQVQCVSCNIFKAGEQYKFGLRLDAELGEGTAEEMMYLSNQSGKYSIEMLREMVAYYQAQLRGLE
jgi:hypothetical protein